MFDISVPPFISMDTRGLMCDLILHQEPLGPASPQCSLKRHEGKIFEAIASGNKKRFAGLDQ